MDKSDRMSGIGSVPDGGVNRLHTTNWTLAYSELHFHQSHSDLMFYGQGLILFITVYPLSG